MNISFGTEKHPKGPDFKKARKIQKNISGTQLSFEAPPHRDPISSLGSWECEPDSLDLLESSLFRPQVLANEHEIENHRWARVYSSRWGFNGIPILEGYRGHMSLLVDVQTFTELPVNESLFDNRVLAREIFKFHENSCENDLNEGYSDIPNDITNHEWPSSVGPINCQWLNLNGKDWLYFEIQPLYDTTDLIEWHTAIDDKHYLTVRFVITRSAPNAGNPFRIAQRVSNESFLALMTNIMNSLRLDLSPNSQVKWEKVKTQPKTLERPIYKLSEQQIKEANHVMYMWSGAGFRDPNKPHKKDHRASPEEVASFLKDRIRIRALPNSYPIGETSSSLGSEAEDKSQTQQSCA